MPTTSVYPVLMCRDVSSSADFFRDAFGFETVFETDWYVSLASGSNELALLAHDHATIPADYGALARGVIVNIEVDDIDDLHSRLAGAGYNIVSPLRDEDFGQRHFIVAGPHCLVDVIQPIPPSAEFLAAYQG